MGLDCLYVLFIMLIPTAATLNQDLWNVSFSCEGWGLCLVEELGKKKQGEKKGRTNREKAHYEVCRGGCFLVVDCGGEMRC